MNIFPHPTPAFLPGQINKIEGKIWMAAADDREGVRQEQYISIVR